MRRSRSSTSRGGGARRNESAARDLLRDETGTAALEFIGAGLILLVPLVYLVVTMAAVQGAALGVEGAARQAARVFVTAEDEPDAEAAASRAVEFALADYGIDPDSASVRITCEPDPDDCLARRGFVTVSISARVALPLMPAIVASDAPGSVTVGSSAIQQVSRFRGAR